MSVERNIALSVRRKREVDDGNIDDEVNLILPSKPTSEV
jgi:hypothetical protein